MEELSQDQVKVVQKFSLIEHFVHSIDSLRLGRGSSVTLPRSRCAPGRTAPAVETGGVSNLGVEGQPHP